MPIGIAGWTALITMLVTFLGVAWKVMRVLARHESLMADYPPHRHLNGRIIYPHEYEPSKVESLSGR